LKPRATFVKGTFARFCVLPAPPRSSRRRTQFVGQRPCVAVLWIQFDETVRMPSRVVEVAGIALDRGKRQQNIPIVRLMGERGLELANRRG
jgi:hypothetical protein